MAIPSNFETARKPVSATRRYRKGIAVIFSVFRLLVRAAKSLLFKPLAGSPYLERAPKGAAAVGRLALITLVTAATLATLLAAVGPTSGTPYERPERPETAPERSHAPFSYASIVSAFDHDDASYNPEAYCRAYDQEGASAGVPENPGARAVFPLPEEYLSSYEDTWGAARPQGDHEGTDLMAPTGTPEYAITDGTIVPVTASNENGWNSLGGYAVMLEAAYSVGPIKKGDLFYYAHLDEKSTLPVGTKVRAGQQIGVAGDTGQGPEGTRGLFPPHLHLGWYDTTGTTSEAGSGAMNPYPLLEWLKQNGGTVVGGWGSEEATAEYCEYQSRTSTAPAEAHGSHQDATPGSSADLDTGSSDPRPSPVAKRNDARGAPAGRNAQEAYCQGSDGGRSSIASSGAWRAVLPPPAKFLYSLLEWTRKNGGPIPGACEEDLAASHPTQPGSGEAKDLLANPNFEASPQAVEDLRAGIVDERLIATLQAIVEKHRIYVNVFKTGHTFGSEFPEGPIIPANYGSGGGHPNTHYFGRAADIWEVDGSSILGCGSHPAVVDVGRMLAGIPPQQRPDVIIGPSAWNRALDYPREAGWILDDDQVARHEDHLHIGFYSEEGTSNTVSPALGPRDEGEEKQNEVCSGALAGRAGDPLAEHQDHPETYAGPKQSNATRNRTERAADKENRPDKIAQEHSRQKATSRTPGRVVLSQEAPEGRSAAIPVPKPAGDEPARSSFKKPNPRKAEQVNPGTREPEPEPKKSRPKELEPKEPVPKRPEPREEKPKPEEPAPQPTPATGSGETDILKPDKPADQQPESDPEGPERPEPEAPRPEEPEPEAAPEEAVAYGSILPIAFHDRDGDAIRDTDEEWLAGWSATLTATGSAGEPTTGETGTPFERLPAGYYVVTVEPPAGYAATSPEEKVRVGLEAQQDQQVTFGFVQPADVTVLVCGDANGDGSCADEGVPKTSLKIQLLNSKGETVARGITDRHGRHRFDGLLPGNYTLVAENPDRANPEERAETSLVIEEGYSLLYDLAVP